MTISIKNENLSAIADAIMEYVFISARKDDNILDVDILCNACDTHRAIKHEAETSTASVSNIEFTQELADFLRYAISEYITDEIRDGDDEKIDTMWLCCTVDFYRQLTGEREAEDIYPDNEKDIDPLSDEDTEYYPDDEEEILAYEDKKHEEEDELEEDEEDDGTDFEIDSISADIPWLT